MRSDPDSASTGVLPLYTWQQTIFTAIFALSEASSATGDSEDTALPYFVDRDDDDAAESGFDTVIRLADMIRQSITGQCEMAND